MKNLIYQYWDGSIPVGSYAGQENMKAYAKSIGADYRFDDNQKYFGNRYGKISFAFGCFRPIHDEEFHQYDNVLVLDTDIFAVDGLKENVFETFAAQKTDQGITPDIGACKEPFQPKNRIISKHAFNHNNDEKWARCVKDKWGVDLPRNNDDLLKVYNGGFMLFSNRGLRIAKTDFCPIGDYIQYIRECGLPVMYARDQNYFHAMIFACKMRFAEMDDGWDSAMHFVGTPDKNGERPVNARVYPWQLLPR